MAERSEKTILDYVLEYYSLGWCVIPIGANKRPSKGFKWKTYQKTRPDEKQLRKWFDSGKYTSLAVVCGAVSGGLAVLDLDSEERCRWWHKEHSELVLPTVKTKKGLHIYFRAEPFRKQNRDDVDLLCEGAYVILPPSPDKEWLTPLNGELPLLNPFEWGLEQFGVKTPEKQARFTEETEDIEETEDTEDIERHRSHKVERKLSSFSEETVDYVNKAIESTIPQKLKTRNDNIFVFCQWLKGIIEMRDLEAIELKPVVRLWWEQAYDNIGTKPFMDTWADFVHGWKRVKWPKGVLEKAVKKALEAETVLPELEQYKDIPEAVFLGTIFYELQQIMGEKPIFLASRKGQGIVGVSHATILKWTEMFEADGILVKVKEHTKYAAPQYRYIAN
jgi:hypothetical protein